MPDRRPALAQKLQPRSSMMNEAGIRWVVVHDVCVSYSNGNIAVSDANFDRWLGAIRNAKVRAILATSHGRRKTTPAQWRRAVAVDLGKPGVIISDDRAARAMATAASWVGANVRGFDWPQFNVALEFLAVPASHWSIYTHAVQSLRGTEPHTIHSLSL